MEAHPVEPAEASQTAPVRISMPVIAAVLAASAAIAGFAISTQSYWIDEALSLIVAKAANPSEAWRYAQAVSGSTLQMPLYQFYLFLWDKVLGGSEWTMRASNIPWLVLAQAAFLILLRDRPKLALTTALLVAVSPILWMYLDETRPYIMQFAAACWLTAGLATVLAPSPAAWPSTRPGLFATAMGAAVAVLFGASLLGVVWAGAFILAFAWVGLSRFRPAAGAFPKVSATHIAVAVGLLAVLAVLAAYYALTWASAGRGYHRSGASLLTLPFVAYEFLGFSGFGPGKLELRGAPLRSVLHAAPALLPLAATLGMFALFVLRHWRSVAPSHRALAVWGVALVLPGAFLLVALFFADHRPLPRHFIPALPATLLALAAIILAAFTQKSLVWRTTAVLLPLLWLGSSLNFRWQPVHAKDDYRTAARIAAEALKQNKEVWWAADPAAAYIYLTPIAMEEVPGRAWAMQAPAWDDIRFKFPPRVIIMSKPDIYDPRGAVARYAAENHFAPVVQLQAFTVLTRRNEPIATFEP